MIRFDTKKDYEKWCKEQEELIELEKENQQLKLDYELYKDNHTYKNYEVERKDITIKQLNSTLEEIREYTKEHKDYLEKAKEMYIDCENELLKTSCIQLINNELVRSDNLLQIIDKAMEGK